MHFPACSQQAVGGLLAGLPRGSARRLPSSQHQSAGVAPSSLPWRIEEPACPLEAFERGPQGFGGHCNNALRLPVGRKRLTPGASLVR